VDPGTLAKWERGERKPAGAFLGRVTVFLHDGEAPARDARGRAALLFSHEVGPVACGTEISRQLLSFIP
jgi:hypothetical protein